MSSQALVDASEMKTFFTSDLRGLEEGASRAPQIVARSTAQINAVLAQPASGFDTLGTAAQKSAQNMGSAFSTVGPVVRSSLDQIGNSAATNFATVSNTSRSSLRDMVIWGDGISTSVRKFTSDLQAVPASFSPITSAAPAIGQAVVSSVGQATSSLSSMVPAAAAAASSFVPIGVNVQDAGAKILASSSNALGGLQSLAQGTLATGSSMSALQATAEGLSGRISSNKEIINQWGGEVARGGVQLAELKSRITDATREFGAGSAEVGKLKSQYVDLSNATSQMSRESGVLSQENRVLGAQLRETSTAQKLITQSTEVLSEKTGFLTKLFGTKTNMVATAGTAFMGYDRVLQTFLGSIGGVTLGVSLLITAAGFLIPKIFGAKKETEGLSGVTKDLIESDLVLVRVFSALAASGGDVEGTLSRQADTYRKLIEADISVLLTTYVAQYKQLATEQGKAISSNDAYLRTTEALSQVQKENAQETIPELMRSTAELEFVQKSFSESTKESTTEQGKYEKSLSGTTEALMAGYRAGVISEQQIYALVEAHGGGAEAVAFMRGEIDKATHSVYDYDTALGTLKKELNTITAPKFDLDAVSLATQQQKVFDSLRLAFDAGITNFKKQVAVAGPEIKKLIDQIHKDAASSGKSVAQVMAGLEPTMGNVIGTYKTYEKALGEMSAKQKKVKEELDKNSPLITERVLAANPGEIEKALSGISDDIRESFLEMRDGVSESGKELTKALFKGMQDAVSGSDFKIGADILKEFSPQIDKLGAELETLQARVIETLGGGKSVRDNLMEGYVKQTLEALGITGEAWLKYSAARRAEINNILVPAASHYADSILAMQLRVQTSLEELSMKHLVLQHNIATGTVKFMVQPAETFARVFGQTTQSIVQDGETQQKTFDVLGKKVTDFASESEIQMRRVKAALDSSFIFDSAKLTNDVGRASESVIREFEEMANRIGLTGDKAWNFVITNAQTVLGRLPAEFKSIGERTLRQWGDDLTRLNGPIDDFVNKTMDALGVLDVKARQKIKGTISDMQAVIATLPGSIGESARKAESQFMKIFSAVDAVTRLIQGLLNRERTGIAGVLADIIGSNQKATTAAQTSAQQQTAALGQVNGALERSAQGWENWSARVQAANQQAQAAAANTKFNPEGSGGAVGGFGGLGDLLGGLQGVFSGGGSDGSGHSIGGGLAAEAGGASGTSFAAGFLGKLSIISSGIATFMGSRGQGRLAGILGGAAAGAQIGSMFLPGIGTAIGAGIGAIAGLFGSGKSAEQKAAEKAAAERAKLDAQGVGQTIVNNYLDGLMKGLEFLSKLPDYTKVPRKAFNQFFKDFRRVLDEFVAMSTTFTASMVDKMKVFAEGIAPVMDVVAKGVEAFNVLPSLTSVPQRAFDAFGSAMTGVIVTFASVIESVENKLINHARKLAKKTGETVQLIKDGVEGFNALSTFKGVATGAITGFGSVLLAAVTELDKVFQQFDNAGLKQSQRFSERSLSIVNLIGQGVASFVQLASFGGISTDAAVKFGSALSFAIQTIATVAETLGIDLVASAQRFSDKAGSSVQLIGTAISSFKDLADIKEIPLSAIAALGNGIHAAVQALVGIASVIGAEAIEAAGKFSSSAVDVFKLISESVKGFTDLGNLRDIYPAAIENLSNGIELAVNAMGRLAAKIDSKLLAEAQKVSTGFNSVLSTVSAGVSAFKDLGIDHAGNAPIFGTSGIDSLFGNVEYAINRMIGLSQKVDAGALEKAVSFGNTSLGIFNAMKEGIGLLKLLPEIPGIAIASYDAFVNGVFHVVDTLSRSLEAVLQAHGISIAFKDAAANTDANIAAGIASLSSSLNRAGFRKR